MLVPVSGMVILTSVELSGELMQEIHQILHWNELETILDLFDVVRKVKTQLQPRVLRDGCDKISGLSHRKNFQKSILGFYGDFVGYFPINWVQKGFWKPYVVSNNKITLCIFQGNG